MITQTAFVIMLSQQKFHRKKIIGNLLYSETLRGLCSTDGSNVVTHWPSQQRSEEV